jgi:hypothetical protein
MSASDVPPSEMGTDPNAAGDALGRMLSGDPVDDEWRDVALFVDELQEAVPTSDLASEGLHVATMVETAHLLAEKGDPAVRPVSNAAAPAPQASGLPKQRRKPMKWKLAKVLAPIAAVLTVFGGIAYAGTLPRSVQNAVSHTAGTVGIELPNDDDAQDALDENDQGEDTQGDESRDDVEAPDQGENDGSQGDNDEQGEDTQGESSDESTSSDDQGANDDSQGDNDNQGEDTQGDETDQTSGDDQQGDSQGDGSDSSGDQQGDSQD